MRVFLIVLDGVGMGALPDAGRYGDAGANTLLHVADSVGRLALPVMETLGLRNLLPMQAVGPPLRPIDRRGVLTEQSAGQGEDDRRRGDGGAGPRPAVHDLPGRLPTRAARPLERKDRAPLDREAVRV